MAANLRAVRALRRSLPNADPATRCMLELAATLAAQVDAAVSGGQPGYVVAKLTSSYAGVLQLLTQLVAPGADSEWDRFLARMSTPVGPGFD